MYFSIKSHMFNDLCWNLTYYSRLALYIYKSVISCTSSICLVGWLCLTSHRQRGHLETAPPFTVPCERSEARLIHRSDRELNPGPSHGSPLRYRCATQAPSFCLVYTQHSLMWTTTLVSLHVSNLLTV